MKSLDVIIIGGGLAGLACASKLVDGSKVVIVLEAASLLGGQHAQGLKLTIAEILDYLSLHGNLVHKVGTDSIDFLTRYVERYGGEIILETPATKLEYSHQINAWSVATPWGELQTDQLVITLPVEQMRDLLNPILGREEWFNTALNNLDQSRHLLFTKEIYHGLYLAGDYTEAGIDNKALAALASGKRVARSLLRL